MSSFHKVIKYGVMTLAILLVVGIISTIVNVVFGFASFVADGIFPRSKGEYKDFSQVFTGVESLDIENSVGEIRIVVGETFHVEAVNVGDSFQAKVTSSGTLKVTEKNIYVWKVFNRNGWNNRNSIITIYLPKDFVANKAEINSGAGKVTIDSLKTERLIINAGAGDLKGSNMTAGDVKIDGGVGTIKFTNVNFRDADIDCGVGLLEIKGELLGYNKIDCGVGEVNLQLNGKKEDYNLDIDSGIGTIRVNGDKLSKSELRDSGVSNTLKVNGGVGTVRIDFKEEF